MHRAVTKVTTVAAGLGLGGFVRTDRHGATLELEGPAEVLGDLVELLGRTENGPWVGGGELPPLGATEFAVLAVSARRTAAAAHRGSDVALCPECVAGLTDPDDPRYRDPFAGCPLCQRSDAGSETGVETAGARASRVLRLRDATGAETDGEPVAGAATLLLAGRIVAVRDPSRYRLLGDATRPAVVATLAALAGQARGRRVVALCPDPEWVRRLAVVDDTDLVSLAGRRNPVLLVEPQPAGPAADLARTDPLLAVTLPGCALTHLLTGAVGRPLAYLDSPAWPTALAAAAVAPAVGVLCVEPTGTS